MILLLFFGSILAWSAYSAVSLYQNVRRARALGLPTKILPVSPMNTLWAASEPLVFGIIDKLPFRLGSLSRYGRRAWHFHEKAASHLELGEAFSIVSPGEIFVYVSNPDAIVDIFSRRADFARPLEIYQMLAVYGSNVSTVGWLDWQRQRKIVGAAFNENTNKLVWTESLAQAKDMLQAWTCSPESGVEGTAQDTRTLSLDVLAATGFRKSYAFRASTEPTSKNNPSRGYRESLKIVMDNSIFMMIAPPKLLSLPIAPRKWQRVGQATRDFKNYMMAMLNDEKSLLNQGKAGTGTIMTSLVRQSEDSKKPNADNSKALSVQEILGNVFVINFAGHDTTANTLAYAMFLLAAHPDVQDWMRDEIRAFVGCQNSETWSYDDVFPSLKRTMAILLETIRLYPPIMAIPKTTHNLPQSLKINEKIVTMPPHTFVVPSLLAVQTHPEFWGPDPLVWRPSRWITTTSDDMSDGTDVDYFKRQTFLTPLKGTYFPWSDGPQFCPGKKFAQVEFVAVLSNLFRDHRVKPALNEGESEANGRKRALGACEDSEHVLLLRMRDGDSTRLVWERVEGNN